MTNYVLGTVTVLVCVLGYVLAFQYFRKGHDFPAILLIVLCGFLLRFFTGADLYLHEWDERFHALVAKNLIKHPLFFTLYDHPLLSYDYTIWRANHVWLHKQPLPLWSMALSMKVFGINEIALRLPSIILSTVAVYLTFHIGRMLFNHTVGFIAAFFHSINGLIIMVTTGRQATDHPELFHLFFVELAVFLVVYSRDTRKNTDNALIGLALGAAILCKWLTALIVLPIWFILMRRKETYSKLARNLGIILFFCIITFLPWQVYIHKAFPVEAGWEDSFNIRHITETLELHSGPFYYHFMDMMNNFGVFIYIPVVWFFARTVRNLKDENLMAIAVWFLIPYLFFTCVQTRMPAYTLFAAPSVFIMLGFFIDHALKKIATFNNRRMAATFLILMFFVPALLGSLNSVKPFKKMSRNPIWAIELRNLDKTIPEKNTVIFNSVRPIETMFYSSFTAYPGLPTAEQVTDLTQRGYKIHIMGKGFANTQ
jgi:4-amino-4-deoxy-L-arabinose transferase-like glycosyltransferase